MRCKIILFGTILPNLSLPLAQTEEEEGDGQQHYYFSEAKFRRGEIHLFLIPFYDLIAFHETIGIMKHKIMRVNILKKIALVRFLLNNVRYNFFILKILYPTDCRSMSMMQTPTFLERRIVRCVMFVCEVSFYFVDETQRGKKEHGKKLTTVPAAGNSSPSTSAQSNAVSY